MARMVAALQAAHEERRLAPPTGNLDQPCFSCRRMKSAARGRLVPPEDG